MVYDQDNRELIGLKYHKGPNSPSIETVSVFHVNLNLQNEAKQIRDKDDCVEWIDQDGFTHQIPDKNIFDRIYMEERKDE